MKVEIIDEYVTYKVLGGKFKDLSPELKKLLTMPGKSTNSKCNRTEVSESAV